MQQKNIFFTFLLISSFTSTHAISLKKIEKNVRNAAKTVGKTTKKIIRNPKGQLFKPTAQIPKTAYRLVTNNFYEVEKGQFYRSKQLSDKRLAYYLKKYHIKTVINLRGENSDAIWWQKERDLLKKQGVLYHNIALSAKTMPSRENIIKLLDIYKFAPRPIYVHCYSGSDRTGLASALWALDQQNKPKQVALEQLTFKYGHLEQRFPQNRRFINLWKGRTWAYTMYNPKNYLKNVK